MNWYLEIVILLFMSRALIEQKLMALRLRKKGMSYSQIKKKVHVSKSSLSLWLYKYPLSKERIKKLQMGKKKIERFRETMRLKRETKLAEVYKKEKKLLLPLSNKEVYLSGLSLYWGEGGKTERGATILSNTKPEMIRFFIYWLVNVIGVPKNKLWIKLHLYADMDEKKEIKFWCKELGLLKSQFKNSYVKETTLRGLTFKGVGHGTCNIGVWGTELKDKVMMGIKVIEDQYSKVTW